MAGYLDSIYQYGSGIGGTGAVATPSLMGFGASDPTGAYLQSAAAPDMGSGGGIASGIAGIGGVATPNLMGTTAPRVGGVGGAGSSGFGFNIPTVNLLLGGLQTIGGLYNAYEANKLAKQQFAFQKDFALKNLANSIKSYNTNLEDKITSRYFTQGQGQDEANSYIASHRLDDANKPA
ncbi:MAG: hypothetical protein EOQ44_25370 [Mesorhizobium sp.]|uniref:hypothetical protein n=1 Tax=Mesorhizobium sp. TaxID=1871066 RepID=UPI000FE9BEF5|nr:hypothetical protein [Mesorhizobium sp.]RWB40471.1 MAG: hypothetical protein EOQ44_25370 [Mesorhizobium sp.]